MKPTVGVSSLLLMAGIATVGVLPITFAQEGRTNLSIQKVTGANTVISELWIWRSE